MTKYANRKLGPNVKKLLCTFVAHDAIPDGGGLADGVAFLSNKDRIISTTRAAMARMFECIDAVKHSRDNPYGDDDEAIAEAILSEIEQKKTR